MAAFAVHCQEEHEEQTDPIYNNSSAVTYAKITAEDLCQVFKWQIFKYILCRFILDGV